MSVLLALTDVYQGQRRTPARPRVGPSEKSRLVYVAPADPDLLPYKARAQRPVRKPLSFKERSRIVPSPPFEGDYLTTFAANALPMTSFFSNSIIEIARNNVAALVLSLSGVKHTADVVVTVGHQHDTAQSRLWWRPIFSWPFNGNGDASIVFGTSATEACYDAVLLNSAALYTFGWARVWATPVELARVIPRLRVSNDIGAVITNTITLEFYSPATMTLIATSTFVFDTSAARNRVWVQFAPIDLSGAAADPDQPTRDMVLIKMMGQQSAALQPVAIHELQLGVLP